MSDKFKSDVWNFFLYRRRSEVQKVDTVKIDLTPVIMIVQAFGHFDVFLVLKPSRVLSNLFKV